MEPDRLDELGGTPRRAVTVPPELAAVVGTDATECVWENSAGGLTFRCTGGDGVRYVKWSPAGSELDLIAEAARMRWAGARLNVDVPRVPTVLDADPDGRWLVTAAIDGDTAIGAVGQADPRAAARAIGVGLRMLHDALRVEECPFDWSVERRRTSPTADPQLVRALGPAPAIDRLVVCHGDACAPNTLLAPDGSFVAQVDFDALGVADRWADLAVATMSLGWNFEDDLESELLDAYGVAADPIRTAYYRALWNAT